MKTIAFVALAVLGLVLGTANLVSPVHAATYYFRYEPFQRRERWRRQQLTRRGL